eukprot:COSAG03_NODE_10694_length_634_cov_960.048598_3_plen_20_part_01
MWRANSRRSRSSFSVSRSLL